MRYVLIILGFFLFLFAPSVSPAEEAADKPMATVTPYLGGAKWDDILESRKSWVYGLRGAYQVTPHFAIEGGYNLSNPEASSSSLTTIRKIRIWNLGIMAGLRPKDEVNPYLVLGFNQMLYSANGGESTDSYNGFEVGVGLSVKLRGDQASYQSLRFEIRDAIVDSSSSGDDTRWTSNLLVTLGVMIATG